MVDWGELSESLGVHEFVEESLPFSSCTMNLAVFLDSILLATIQIKHEKPLKQTIFYPRLWRVFNLFGISANSITYILTLLHENHVDEINKIPNIDSLDVSHPMYTH
jgi:hypothetical protein